MGPQPVDCGRCLFPRALPYEQISFNGTSLVFQDNVDWKNDFENCMIKRREIQCPPGQSQNNEPIYRFRATYGVSPQSP